MANENAEAKVIYEVESETGYGKRVDKKVDLGDATWLVVEKTLGPPSCENVVLKKFTVDLSARVPEVVFTYMRVPAAACAVSVSVAVDSLAAAAAAAGVGLVAEEGAR